MVGTAGASSRPTEPQLNTGLTRASMRFKVTNTNRLRDSHCRSRIQALVHVQSLKFFFETIKLPPLMVYFIILCNVIVFENLELWSILDKVLIFLLLNQFGNPIYNNFCCVNQG
jgi:hypothetical protein